MKKKIVALALSLVMGLSMNIVSYADEAIGQSARWQGSGDEWRVSDNQGGYLKNCWFQDDVTKHWYLLGGGEDGSLMFSGLIKDQSTGKTYLLNTNHDGTFGRMLTVDGEYTLNGQKRYITYNQHHDGTFGAITSDVDALKNTGITNKELSSIPTGESGSQSTSNTSGGGKTSGETKQSGGGNYSQADLNRWDLNHDGILDEQELLKKSLTENHNFENDPDGGGKQNWK